MPETFNVQLMHFTKYDSIYILKNKTLFATIYKYHVEQLVTQSCSVF